MEICQHLNIKFAVNFLIIQYLLVTGYLPEDLKKIEHILDEDGLPYIGALLYEGDPLYRYNCKQKWVWCKWVCLISYIDTDAKKSIIEYYKSSEPAYVDQVCGHKVGNHY